MFSFELAGKMGIRGQIPARLHTLYGYLRSKSLERSPAVGDFYGTGIKIWPGFGPICNTEKRVWADYEQLLKKMVAKIE